jgi:hypothetical protein
VHFPTDIHGLYRGSVVGSVQLQSNTNIGILLEVLQQGTTKGMQIHWERGRNNLAGEVQWNEGTSVEKQQAYLRCLHSGILRDNSHCIQTRSFKERS